MRKPAPEKQVISWFDELSNWNRWGSDDVLGTLNHITRDKLVSSSQLVRTGQSVSCSWDIRTGRQPGAMIESQRYMIGTGLGLQEEGRRGAWGPGRAGAAFEYVGMVFHGHDITHLDALSHVFWDGKMYNGHPSTLVDDFHGAMKHDVLSVSQGVVTRGVLLDIAQLRGVDVLDPEDLIYPEDLEAAEEAAGVKVESGDVLLVRTGEGYLRRVDRKAWDAHRTRSGIQAACLPWLYEREISMLGSDIQQDVVPSGYPMIPSPIHLVGIVAMGLWLIDNCQLEDLAETCRELGRWDFQFVLAPTRFMGVTGSPVNPLAVF